MTPPFAELDQLLCKLCEHEASAEDIHRLNELLHSDKGARRHYLRYMALHGALHWNLIAADGPNAIQGDSARALQNLARKQPRKDPTIARDGTGAMSIRPDPADEFAPPRQIAPSLPPATRRRGRLLGQRDWKVRLMAAAILVLATSMAWMIFGPKARQIATGPDSTGTHGITPTTSQVPVLPVILSSGFTRLTLDGKVDVLIEGPAEYEILSGSRLRLNSGRLTAVVPHTAVGFTVETKEAQITDLGTEFGVEADYNFTETEVFAGRVAVEPREDGTRVREVLSAGQANHVSGTGQIQQIEAGRGRLVRVGDYDARKTAEARGAVAFERWSACSRQLRRDPSLLAYYTFDNQVEAPLNLLNRSAATAGQYDGEIANAAWDDGHLPGRHALRFNGKDSCVKINIPNQSSQMTLLAWVRIDSWANRNTGVVMSDGWSSKGKIHWQFAGHSPKFSVWPAPDALSFVSPDSSSHEADVGHWVHLAVTCDAKTSTIALYRDGAAEASGKVPVAAQMSIGLAQIGSWDRSSDPTKPDFRNRTLDGRIDELAIFDRVLSATEIRAIYESEKSQ